MNQNIKNIYRKLSFTLAALMSLATMGRAVPAHAAQAKVVANAPAICKNLANYAAQMMHIVFTRSGGPYGEHNPASMRLYSDFSKFAIGKVTDLGNCDDDPDGSLKPEWCTGFGGGSFEIFKLAMIEPKSKTPAADVIVNYNSRGACVVREINLPPAQN